MIPIRNTKRFIGKALRQPGYAARVALRRLAAYLAYWRGSGRAPMPESITLFLTHRCNLRCKMCGQWGEGGVTKKEGADFVRRELPLPDLERFIDDVAVFRPNITLFGGEPFLHPGAVELIGHIKSRGMHCLVISNGYLALDLADRLVAAGLDELNVSLDGSRELHDEIRGMPGLFDRIMTGLQKVAAAKERLGKKRPLVNLQCTVTKYNYRHLEQMVAVARDARADSLTFHNLIFLDPVILERQRQHDERLGASSADWRGFAFEPGIDPDLLWEKMRQIRSMPHDFGIDLYPNFNKEELREYYRNPAFAPRGTTGSCVSPWIVAYVFPDGEVRPCLNSTYTFGNIAAARFPEIWNSGAAVRFRRELKTACAFPVCARCTELYRY